jgi:hypothetical protein
MKSITNKLEEVDEVLSSFEDWMHGKDGYDCTKARQLLREAIRDIRKVKTSIEEINNTVKDGISSTLQKR